MTQPDIIQSILKDSNFHLSLFSNDEIDSLRSKVFTKTMRGKEKPFLKCKKHRQLRELCPYHHNA